MSNFFRKALEEVPQSTKDWVSQSFDITEQIFEIMERLEISQKELAKRLEKSESEVSKWMRGTHNFTIDTVRKIERALGEPILITILQAKERFEQQNKMYLVAGNEDIHVEKGTYNFLLSITSSDVDVHIIEQKLKVQEESNFKLITSGLN